ncbi:MAG TPA: aldo/keto reductase [Ktedonobacteraceae bacterium]|nr:aldo/keto reductase [Ktedonobacteraceae bacterium]
MMHYRTLGRTGLSVSEIGYGALGISGSGWIGAQDRESLQALQIAIDRGVNFIDTALGYGDGHSEQLIGQVLRHNPDKQIIVATKIPPKNSLWPAPTGVPVEEAFPGSHIQACTEQSLRNLGTATLDIEQFHAWNDEWIGQGDWQETIQRLKDQGKIRYFGVSINDLQPDNAIRLIETGLVDTVQVIYNIFEQSPEDALFPACQRHNVGVIARVALDEGGLTGTITPQSHFDPQDFRTDYFRGNRKQEVYEHVQNIVSDLGITVNELPEIALRYVLSHPAVSTVIPGMRTIRNVERNTTYGDGKGLPPDQIQKLKKHRWERNFYA